MIQIFVVSFIISMNIVLYNLINGHNKRKAKDEADYQKNHLEYLKMEASWKRSFGVKPIL
jgi:hypothetical protein